LGAISNCTTSWALLPALAISQHHCLVEIFIFWVKPFTFETTRCSTYKILGHSTFKSSRPSPFKSLTPKPPRISTRKPSTPYKTFWWHKIPTLFSRIPTHSICIQYVVKRQFHFRMEFLASVTKSVVSAFQAECSRCGIPAPNTLSP